MPARTSGTRTIGDLFRDLAEDGVSLFREEVKLARVELSAAARGAGVGTGSLRPVPCSRCLVLWLRSSASRC